MKISNADIIIGQFNELCSLIDDMCTQMKKDFVSIKNAYTRALAESKNAAAMIQGGREPAFPSYYPYSRWEKNIERLSGGVPNPYDEISVCRTACNELSSMNKKIVPVIETAFIFIEDVDSETARKISNQTGHSLHHLPNPIDTQVSKINKAISYATLAKHIYTADSIGETVGEYTLEHIYQDKDTSLKIGIYSKTDGYGNKSYVIANKGTTFDKDKGFFKNIVAHPSDWANNLAQPFGVSPDAIASLLFVSAFVKSHPNSDICFVGHSKGGAEAMLNAISTGKDAYVFNPASTYPEQYGLKPDKYKGQITSYVVDGEALDTLDSVMDAADGPANMMVNNIMSGGNPIVNAHSASNAPQNYQPDSEVRLYVDDSLSAFKKHDLNTVISSLENEKKSYESYEYITSSILNKG